LSSLTASVTLYKQSDTVSPKHVVCHLEWGMHLHQRIGLLLLLEDGCCSLVILWRHVSEVHLEVAI